ncbi:hypothetical protein Cgig2_007477 [Carnegiea gigantea]|uniref:Uncharacterized protein n=1 Tax=Carnegiea gigantea TaxID=171969 RepID=A0A9Q1K6W5_9CARY|nr:hypothetical protein Cgig2_007477 [Carnegiea gigantea]
MIHLPLRFGDKGKAKNMEVDFLVVDVRAAYNIILGRPMLHKVKAIIAPYLLQLQFEADDGSVSTMQGDQLTAQECYLRGKGVHSTYLSHNHLILGDLGVSEVPEAAKSHDLARSQTNSSLATESSTKKLVDRARPPRSRGKPSLPLENNLPRTLSVLKWHPHFRKASASPSLVLHKAKKSQVSPPRVSTDKEEVILPILYFGFLLNGRHITWPVVKTISP